MKSQVDNLLLALRWYIAVWLKDLVGVGCRLFEQKKRS